MNYQRIRLEAKKKIEAKKQQLSVMSGEDRTKLEQHLIKEAELEELAKIKAENESLKKQIQESDEQALKLLEENEKLDNAQKASAELATKVLEENKVLEEKVAELTSPVTVEVKTEVTPGQVTEEVKKQQPQQRQHKSR